MVTDVRISTAMPQHPKTLKLIRLVGQAGAWNLVVLFAWAAANRSDGDMSGLSDEDIELAAQWDGAPNQFVNALSSARFLDGTAGARRLHDWADHNPWAAGAGARSAKARWKIGRAHV